MKIILLFLLLPLTIFSQTQTYPDTLVAHHSKVYPCRIIKIDPPKIKFLFGANQLAEYSTRIAKKLIVESYGSIYSRENGFTEDLEVIKSFINKRESVYLQLNQLDSLSAIPVPVQLKPEQESVSSFNVFATNYSFGFYYSPFVQGVSAIYFNDYDSRVSMITEYSTIIESQFTTKLKDKLNLTLNIAYNSSRVKTRYEYHVIDLDPINQNDFGMEELNSLKIFTLETGLKYYFRNSIPEQTNAFIMMGIGKKFAFAKEREKELFQDESEGDNQESDNRIEFLEDLNSPLLMHLGFGAEYYFNKYLSVHSSIRFYYSTISAKYKNTSEETDYRIINTYKNEIDEITTNIGFGLNFYF